MTTATLTAVFGNHAISYSSDRNWADVASNILPRKEAAFASTGPEFLCLGVSRFRGRTR